jgi:DNA-binding transcriptional ArsR family regulator
MSARRANAWINAELLGSAPVFAALGDETRLRLVARLCAGEPLSITQLASGAGVTRQAVTKHLHVLAGAGLIRGNRQGREQHWQLEARRLLEARRCLDLISRQWDEALDRLKALLEGGT